MGAKVDLAFEVTNLNAYTCERVEIELNDPNFTNEKATVDEIAKLKRLPITLPARCHRSADASARDLHHALAEVEAYPYQHVPEHRH